MTLREPPPIRTYGLSEVVLDLGVLHLGEGAVADERDAGEEVGRDGRLRDQDPRAIDKDAAVTARNLTPAASVADDLAPQQGPLRVEG